MPALAITQRYSNLFQVDGNSANINFEDIVTYVNARNDGTTAWDLLRVTASPTTSIAAIISNSTGTVNIASFRDNTTDVLTIGDGGVTAITANGGTNIALTVNNGTSTGNILRLQDNGSNLFTLADGGPFTITGTWDGWIGANETWTFATASTFTVTGDVTAKYTKGTRLKFTQTTAKYAVVVASSVVTDTTVTIAVNNDYTIANASITSPFYSYQANPQAYPQWFNYDPTYTGFSTDPTTDAMYRMVGNECTIAFASISGTSNSATFNLTVPAAPSNPGAGTLAIPIAVVDNGTWNNTIGVIGLLDTNATARVGLTISTIAANTFAGFTTSGTKGLNGTITYRY